MIDQNCTRLPDDNRRRFEKPRDVPDARFALPSTINWMCALAILAADQRLDFAAGRAFYARIQARSMPDPEFNTV